MAKINRLAEDILDFIFPLRCPISSELVDHKGMLSAQAWSQLSFIEAPQCISCGHPFAKHLFEQGEDSNSLKCMRCLENEPAYDQARSRLQYNDVSRALLLKFKHGDQLHLIDSFMPFLQQASADILDEVDIILPVPLHPMRLLQRKYNQAALLASRFAQANACHYSPFILTRSINTPRQHGALKSRKKNVAKAFQIDPNYAPLIRGKNILLIDDVFTTGSTVSACADILKKNAAKKVYVVTIAQACNQH